MLQIIVAGVVIGLVIGIYTNGEKNNGKIVYPQRLKGGFKMGVLRDILTCTIAAFLAMCINFTMDVTDILPLIVNGTLAALLGKEYLVRQRTAAINEATDVKQNRQAELHEEVDGAKKGKGKGAG